MVRQYPLLQQNVALSENIKQGQVLNVSKKETDCLLEYILLKMTWTYCSELWLSSFQHFSPSWSFSRWAKMLKTRKANTDIEIQQSMNSNRSNTTTVTLSAYNINWTTLDYWDHLHVSRSIYVQNTAHFTKNSYCKQEFITLYIFFGSESTQNSFNLFSRTIFVAWFLCYKKFRWSYPREISANIQRDPLSCA